MTNDLSIKEYYNKYSIRQKKIGTNKRHKSILKHLIKNGLKKNSRVLEIGCGIGTQSGLILKHLSRIGFLTAYDISNYSTELARNNNSRFKNVRFICADVTKNEFDGMFDVIVLPDVIEHIPRNDHLNLFLKISKALAPNGFVLVHIPDPIFLEWLKINHPKEIQIIDQCLQIEHFVQIAKETDFYISYMESYCIWHEMVEYQVLILRKIQELKNIKIKRQKYKLFAKVKSIVSPLIK